MNGLKDALNEFRFPDFEKKKKQQNRHDLLYGTNRLKTRKKEKKK